MFFFFLVERKFHIKRYFLNILQKWICHKCHKETDNYGYKARWQKLTGLEAYRLSDNVKFNDL